MARPKNALEYETHLSDADTLMWNLESDPVLRSTVLSLWILDRAPDLARFEAKAEQATRTLPRLRERVVRDPLQITTPKWERDPHFDLRFHVRRTRAHGAGTLRDLLDIAEPIAMQAFDKDRPLWELHLIEGLEGDRAAVVFKLHHAVSDGVGLVKMTECLIEKGPEDDGTIAPSEPEAHFVEPTGWERVRAAFAHRLSGRATRAARLANGLGSNAVRGMRHPFATVREVRETLASAARVLSPASAPLSPVMTERSTLVHFEYTTVPLEDLKRAGKAVGGTINDAFVAAVSGGLARYHEELGEPVEKLRMLMPVNVRTDDTANRAGNQFAPARFEVPVGIANPAERVRHIGSLCREQRDEPALPWTSEIASVLGVFPPAMVGALFGAMQKTTDFTTSNVPGPRRPTWMSGAQVEAVVPFGPLAGAGVNLTVFSYNGTMHLGINSDPAAVSDPKLLSECIQKGLDEVLGLAG